MATPIDHPAGTVQPDSLPGYGDRYQAYGLAQAVRPETVCFVQPDGSMTGFPYSRLGRFSFAPRVAGERDGECLISVVFDRKHGAPGEIVTVIGRDLFACYYHLGHRLAVWLWAAPSPRADDGGPLVRTIEVAEATPAALRASLDRFGRDEADEAGSR